MGWPVGEGHRHCRFQFEFTDGNTDDSQPGGQDSQLIVKDLATRVSANYLLQTADEPPAFICVKTSGWQTGAKDVLEKLNDPLAADQVSPNSYKFRLHIKLETGDERYAFANTCMWVGSGCRRGTEGTPALAQFRM